MVFGTIVDTRSAHMETLIDEAKGKRSCGGGG